VEATAVGEEEEEGEESSAAGEEDYTTAGEEEGPISPRVLRLPGPTPPRERSRAARQAPLAVGSTLP